MITLRTAYQRWEQAVPRTGIRAAFLAVAFLFSHVAQAVPLVVDVYGAPYFTIAGWQGKDETANQWVVLERNQGLSMSLDNNQLYLQGRHDLSARDRSGLTNSFSFTDMLINLPGSNTDDYGFVDYLMGDRSGQFTLEQVIYRSPRGVDNSVLSLFFWGIDYMNGVGMVLGLQAIPSPNNNPAAAQVNEPSMLLLMLIGLGLLGSSRRTNVKV